MLWFADLHHQKLPYRMTPSVVQQDWHSLERIHFGKTLVAASINPHNEKKAEN